MCPTSLYIHIPFCTHRCGYCDFNTYAGLQRLIPDYATAVCKELEYISRHSKRPLGIHTIYFGGGTPSLVPPAHLASILACVRDHFVVSPEVEISLEANPGTLSANYIEQLREMGVNRLSLGMQSALQHELALLDRQHSFDDVIKAVDWAREAGFKNLNLDLIFGLPDQRLPAWLTSLEAAIELQPQHLSLYALTLEHGIPLQHQVEMGNIPEPDPDLAADMYEAASDRLNSAGYDHYEISNWARTNTKGESYACKHNLQYWRTLPYLGVGAGAHGFIDHHRTVNTATPQAYIRRLVHLLEPTTGVVEFPRTPATNQISFINAETEAGELMMMGLRLVQEGVANHTFQQRFGVRLEEKFGTQIERLTTLGLLEWAGPTNESLRLTEKGHLLGNQVFREFV